MIKIAIISSGNPSNMKGIMNYVQEKCSLMKKQEHSDFSVDCYMIRRVPTFGLKTILKLWRHEMQTKEESNMPETIEIPPVTYRCLYYNYGIWNNLISTKIRKEFLPLAAKRRFSELINHYDVIASHTYDAHDLALFCHKLYNIPYIPTWHGSDVYVVPQISPQFKPRIKMIMDNADMNLFVSLALKKESDYLTEDAKKDIIYTGPSAVFQRYSDSERIKLKEDFGVADKKVVAFVGNLIPIKNVLTLPSIFSRISDSLGRENVEFWILGDGNLENELKEKLSHSNVTFRMFGKVAPNDIPKYLNIANLLMLISLNEGLGLVNMEAIKCGCYVVGSNVGGIPEVIGKENAFDLGEQFVDNISKRAIEVLQSGITPEELPAKFSWNNAIKKELSLYESVTERN